MGQSPRRWRARRTDTLTALRWNGELASVESAEVNSATYKLPEAVQTKAAKPLVKLMEVVAIFVLAPPNRQQSSPGHRSPVRLHLSRRRRA